MNVVFGSTGMEVNTMSKLELKFDIPPSFREMIDSGSASAAGYHAVSQWLTCPEKSRLHAIGIQRLGKGREASEFWEDAELNALDYGSLIHCLRAIRIVYGHERMLIVLYNWRGELPPKSYLKALLGFQVYEQMFPRNPDKFTYLSAENIVYSDVGGGIVRTVRYDAIVSAQTEDDPNAHGVYSFELKTAARTGGLSAYMPQAMVQQAVWNANAELVAAHGPMLGVIFDVMVKTKLPTVERDVFLFTKEQEKMALEYMGYPESPFGVQYKLLPDGTFPKMLHACWDRWGVCTYKDLCHDDMRGSYVWKQSGVSVNEVSHIPSQQRFTK